MFSNSSNSSDSDREDNEIFYHPPHLLQAPNIPCQPFDLVQTGIPLLRSTLRANDIKALKVKALKVEMEPDEGYFSRAMLNECPPSRSDEYAVIHRSSLLGGLLLPFLHPPSLDIVQFWGVPLAQFFPTSIRTIVAFIATCHLYRISVSLELFRCFFVLQVPPARSTVSGYLTLYEWPQRLGRVQSPEGGCGGLNSFLLASLQLRWRDTQTGISTVFFTMSSPTCLLVWQGAGTF